MVSQNKPKPKVAIQQIVSGDVNKAVEQALQNINWESFIPAGASVALKPNFTYPFFKQGVTTSPAFIEAVVRVLRERTNRIYLVESDGGAHSWDAEEAFEGHQLSAIEKKYGAKTINLSRKPTRHVKTEIDGREMAIDLPCFLLDETDVFITLPVPKVHVMTHLTLGFKNQWGCIPDVYRLKYHHCFDHMILAVNKLLRTRAVFFDGTYFLNRTGPMFGDTVQKNLVIASDDVGAGSFVAARIMNVDPASAKHKKLAMKIGMMPSSLAEIDCNIDPTTMAHETFYVKMEKSHYIAAVAFRSRLITWLGYESPLAGIAHKMLYLFRGKPKELHPDW